MTLRATADLLDGILREQEIGKYTFTLSQSEKQELNLENGGFKLLRTVFNNAASIKVFLGEKMGSVSGNDLSEDALRRLAADAKAAAEAAALCHAAGRMKNDAENHCPD